MDPQFYGEFRKQLKAAQVAIRVSEVNQVSTKCGYEEKSLLKYSIEVRENSIELSCEEPSARWAYALPVGLRALPGTCSGLEWVKNQGVYLRMQLDEQEELSTERAEEGVCGTVDPEVEKVEGETGDQFMRALENMDCEVVCGRCDAPVVQPVGGFRKVLSLPSGDWSDLAGDLWCCKSKVIAQERGKMTPLHLTPEEGSVLVGDLCMMVNSRALTKGSVNIGRKKRSGGSQSDLQMRRGLTVSCQRCGCTLGSVDTQGGSIQLDTTKLYRYAVRVRSLEKEPSVIVKNPLQYTISSLMVKLFKTQMTFKFIIDDEGEHKPRLLIWLLSIDTRLLCERAPPISPSLPGSSCSRHASPPTHPDSGEGRHVEVDLESHHIIKVLYQTCISEGGQRLAKEWNRDLMVHGITLTKEACLQLGLLLATSTLIAPPAMRQMNGFLVGSMRL